MRITGWLVGVQSTEPCNHDENSVIKKRCICQILSRINDSAPLLFYISLLLQKNHSAAFAFFSSRVFDHIWSALSFQHAAY